MTPEIRTIVVGLGAVQREDPVLVPALELAARFGAALHVVHGYMLADPLLDAYTRAGYLGESTMSRFGQDVQTALETRIAEVAGDVEVRAHTYAGPAVQGLLDTAAQVSADLIVVGATHRVRFPGGGILGSTSRALVRRSSLPVLVLREGGRVPPLRVLAATDLSPLSVNAHRWGRALQAASNGESAFRTLSVINESLLMLPIEQRVLEGVAEKELDTFLQTAGDPGGDRVIRKGDPAGEILAAAEEWNADLIVVGTHGRKGMERFLLGSVADATIRKAPCSILVVPAAGGETSSE